MLSSLLAKYFPESELSTTIFPPKSRFDYKSIPDLSGKVFLVTGGNAGIGYQTIKELIAHDAKVYLGARSEAKALAAIERLQTETGKGVDGQLVFLHLDLGDLHSVKVAAQEFFKKESKLDVLINNAGVMVPPISDLTKHGYDLRTNVLGHYFLTKLLVPALVASHTATGVPARVVNLSSSGHGYAPAGSGFVPSTLVGGPERDAQLKQWGFMASSKLYGQSKLGNLFVSNIFAQSYPGRIVSTSVHPGGIETELQRHLEGGISGWISGALLGLILFPAPMGGINSLYVATVAAPEEINGQYFVPWARLGKASSQAGDVETQHEVKAWMEKELLGYS